MRKVAKGVLFAAPVLSVFAYALYAWAATTQANLKIDSIGGSHNTPVSGVDTYTVVAKHLGNNSGYNVRLSFLVPVELWPQNATLPGTIVSNITPPTGGLPPTCSVQAPGGSSRYVICTTGRFDPGATWTTTFRVNNATAANYFAAAQIFSDVQEGTTVGSMNMTDNFKGKIGLP